jgi:hypothetical protein
MLALHITFIDKTPYLWSETYQIGCYKDLKKAIKAVGVPFSLNKENADNIVVWLPSKEDIIIPSSPLIGPEVISTQPVKLKACKIVAKPLSVDEYISFVTTIGENNIAGTGLILSTSVKWNNSLLKTLLSLFSTDKFFPMIIADEKNYREQINELASSDFKLKIKKLLDLLPGVSRCGSMKKKLSPSTSIDDVFNSIATNCKIKIQKDLDIEIVDETIISESKSSWLQSLTGDKSEKSEKTPSYRHHSNINKSITAIESVDFKYGFRLVEPNASENSDRWILEAILVPKTDTTLYIPIEYVYDTRSKEYAYMAKYGSIPYDDIETAMDQAMSVSNILRRNLNTLSYQSIKLSTEDALLFLEEDSPSLQAASFFIALPSWWIKNSSEELLTIQAKVFSSTMHGTGKGIPLSEIVSFDIKACFNGELIDEKEMEQLALLKAPLVKIKDQWLRINPAQIQSAIQFIKKRKRSNITAREVLELSIGKKKEWNGIPVDGVTTDGWLREVLDNVMGKEKMQLLEQPDGFRGSLREYQKSGFTWLEFMYKWKLGACLADDMGLGKTIQTLAFLQHRFLLKETKPTLLVCPTSVINNWRKEIQKFTPDLSVLVHHGLNRKKGSEFTQTLENKFIVITSYQLLQRDISFLHTIPWAGIIIDEAQNIKNPDTIQSKAVRSLKGGYKIALTGTPIENHVGDLWSIMEFLNPGLLGTQYGFKEEFYKPIQMYQSNEKATRLRDITGPFIMRRVKTDKSIIADLPDKIETKEYCSLTKEQISLYKALTNELKTQLQTSRGFARKGLVLTMLTKLKQVCNHPAHFTKEKGNFENRSGKLLRLCELIEQIRELGDRVLLFTQYAEMGSILQYYLQERFSEQVYYLNGSVPKAKRDEMIDSFQKDTNAPKIFILSLKAGGTGITLTKANHVIHYDRWWNPAVENQATDRAFRIGQTKNVQVHKLIVSGTLEERIDELIERKVNISGQVINTGEQWLSELSNSEINSIIELSEELSNN